MGYYSIAELEQLSGIKAHTIRIWEQRYNALKPMRTEGNTRYYDDRQLKKLLNVVSLAETGIKVSELFSLSNANLNKLISEQIEKSKSANTQFEYFISQMLVSGLSYNEALFEKHFSACLIRYGIRNTYVNIIYPMLIRIGLIWGKDDICPAQEHFMSNLIRQKIISAIDGLPFSENSANTWLLFLPEGEHHEIGLLLSNYLIRSAGHNTIYLGTNVPVDSLKEAIHDTNPSDLFFFIFKNRLAEEMQQYLNELKKFSKNSTIHISGNAKVIKEMKSGKSLDWIESVEQLERNLKLK